MHLHGQSCYNNIHTHTHTYIHGTVTGAGNRTVLFLYAHVVRSWLTSEECAVYDNIENQRNSLAVGRRWKTSMEMIR